jgi:hypothetical protein
MVNNFADALNVRHFNNRITLDGNWPDHKASLLQMLDAIDTTQAIHYGEAVATPVSKAAKDSNIEDCDSGQDSDDSDGTDRYMPVDNTSGQDSDDSDGTARYMLVDNTSGQDSDDSDGTARYMLVDNTSGQDSDDSDAASSEDEFALDDETNVEPIPMDSHGKNQSDEENQSHGENHPHGEDQSMFIEDDSGLAEECPEEALPMFASSSTMDATRVTIISSIQMIEFLLKKKDPYKYFLSGDLTQDFIEVRALKHTHTSICCFFFKYSFVSLCRVISEMYAQLVDPMKNQLE